MSEDRAPPQPVHGRLAAAVATLATRRPRAVVAVTLALVVLSLWRVTLLRLDTDFSQLLPGSDPAVVALEELDRRIAALSSLQLVVEGPDREANRRFVDAVVDRVRALGDPLIDDVRGGVEEEKDFFTRNGYLYASRAALTDANERLERRIAAAKNPLLLDLDADEGADDPKAARAHAAFDAFPGGYYAYADGKLFAVIVWLKSSLLRSGHTDRVVAAVRSTAEALRLEMNQPGQTVGLTGNVVTAAAERRALADDLTFATVLSVLLVCLVVYLYFGRPGAVLFLVVPPLCGVALALGLAQLSFGGLNTITGFLGAIILGNGVNYAVVQMARYEEERRLGRSVPAALAVAVETTWRATGVAALAAAAAYGSLAITDFRGFNQFGYIGGAGMLLSWVATIVVLPALWVLFDRRPADRTVPRVAGFSAAAPLARITLAHAHAVVAAGALVTLGAIVALPRYLRDPFEYDFDKLRNRVSRQTEEKLSARLDPIFGRSLSPGFVLADRASQVEEIRGALRARDPRHEYLGDVKTIDDYLPGGIDEQRDKLAILARIRALFDANTRLLSDPDRARLAELRPPDTLRVITPADLPRSLRRFFTEADGTVGRVVAWFPRDEVNVWDGRVMKRLSAVVRELPLADGSRLHSSGPAVIFAAMLDAVAHDGPIATLASLAAVLMLVTLLARRRGTWLVLGSLGVGVTWMAGGVAAAGVRINFLNFIALPITFGIAADYGVNLYLRYRLEGEGSVEKTVGSTGGALILCSLTTIIGYGALLVADTQGLRTFGAAAILGEFACVTSAIVLMPAVIALGERRRAGRTQARPERTRG